MTGLVVEGLASAWLPCSLVLLFPGALVVLAARSTGRVVTLMGYVVAVAVVSWLRFSGRGGGWPHPVAAAALAGSAVLVAATRRTPRLPRWWPGAVRWRVVTAGPGSAVVALVAGMLAGSAAADLWEPCVGARFGALLNGLPGRGAGGLLELTVHLLGVLAPLAVLAAAPTLLPRRPVGRAADLLATALVGVLVGLAVLTAAGLHHQAIGHLVALSS